MKALRPKKHAADNKHDYMLCIQKQRNKCVYFILYIYIIYIYIYFIYIFVYVCIYSWINHDVMANISNMVPALYHLSSKHHAPQARRCMESRVETATHSET